MSPLFPPLSYPADLSLLFFRQSNHDWAGPGSTPALSSAQVCLFLVSHIFSFDVIIFLVDRSLITSSLFSDGGARMMSSSGLPASVRIVEVRLIIMLM